MQKIFFTPGPTQLYPSIKGYMREAVKDDICSISHRSSDFEQIFENAVSSLKQLLNIPENFHIFFLSSGTEAMERIIENCAAKYSYHFVNGAFSKRFFTVAQALKKMPEKIEFGEEGFNSEKINIPREAELICFTHNETSIGMSLNTEDIYKIKENNADKIAAVDIVSSAPYVDIDYSKIDCSFFSVQKGFGLPAGLGVLIANEKCIEKSVSLQKQGCSIGSYHSFASLLNNADKKQTPETPNVLAIYLLGKISDELNKKGIKKIRKETEEKAELIYDFFDNHASYKPFISNKCFRSKTVAAINVTDSKKIIEALSENGFVIGSGHKEMKDTHIRIANFPMHKKEDMKRMLELVK